MNGLREFLQLRGSSDGPGVAPGGDYVAIFLLGLLFLILAVGALFFARLAQHQSARHSPGFKLHYQQPKKWPEALV